MSESNEKALINAFTSAWNGAVPTILGCKSDLSVLALREVSGDGMAGALAVAATWSWAFIATCSGAMPGVLVCLFKEEEGEELDRLAVAPQDGEPKPGGRALVKAASHVAASSISDHLGSVVDISDAKFIDLGVEDSRLATIVGDCAWVGTCALVVGDDINSQALVVYAPNGALQDVAQPAAAPRPAAVAQPAAPPQAAPQASRRAVRQPEAPRNIDRVLDVELDVVVRFGVTTVALRDVVRMGVGSMVELDRGVDEPVELLINGRPLARGEVVVVDGYYGVRITEIGSHADRTALV